MREVLISIQKRLQDANLKKNYQEMFGRLLILIVLIYLILGHVFLVNQVKGMDMFPAIKDGDLILAFRLHQRFEKNDVLVYENDGNKRVGRIIARENDVITIDEEGTLRVNGTLQSGEIMYPTYPTDTIIYPYHVPENHYFVLGDFRTQALDSRDLGAISKDKIYGKLMLILRRQGL